MNKFDFLIGLIIGFLGTFLGCYIFITLFTDYDFLSGMETIKYQGSAGKLITLGTILDLIIFSVLLKFNKEIMARGVILAVILMTIYTLLI
jgi:hypothetical protein